MAIRGQASGWNRTVDSLRPRFTIADFLKFTAICGLILAVFAWSGVDFALVADWPRSILYPLTIAVVCALTFLRPRPTTLHCELCGREFYRFQKTAATGLCPACRTAKLPPQERRRSAIHGLIIITVLFVMLSFVLLWPFTALMRGQAFAFAYPMVAIGLFLAIFAVYVGGAIGRQLVGMRRMSNPAHALRVARASARQVGNELALGPVSIHFFGPGDPTPMLKGQMDTCRNRFESLVGHSFETERPLRILAFARRTALEAFLQRALLFSGNLDGMYIPWSMATIALSTELPPYRNTGLDRVVRQLFLYFLLDSYKQRPSPLWLQTGIANHLACGGDLSELARLNRRMLAASARGSLLGTADLFQANPKAMIKLVRDWQDHCNFAAYTQFASQSWSLVEFLRGHHEGGERFRSFLAEVSPKASQEELLEQQFGCGFDALLSRWQEWVIRRGPGAHECPPPDVREILVEAAIPTALDLHADPLDRIQAIREIGKAGYVLGADALIKLLGDDDETHREEVIWSLEAISGLALADDVAAWRRWFNGLPATFLMSNPSPSLPPAG
jgi:hypothetical protein